MSHRFFEGLGKETLEIPNLVAEELDFKAVNILLDLPRFSNSLLVSSIWKRRLDSAIVEQDKQEHIFLHKLTFLSQAYLF